MGGMDRDLSQDELDELTAWAESDEPTKSGVTTAIGEEAARQGRELLRRAGVSVDDVSHSHKDDKGSRRRVRLPGDLDSALERYVREEHTSAGRVIRAAVAEFLARRHAYDAFVATVLAAEAGKPIPVEDDEAFARLIADA